jgi:conjugative transposon TraM protein
MSVKAVPDPEDSVRGFDSMAMEAVIPEAQVLLTGGELRLELASNLLIAGHRVPAGTPVYGTASLSGERLRVTISAIAWQEHSYPVNLQVDDEDGLPGIYIPGAPMTDAARESAGSDIGSIGPTMVSTGLAGQAADAGMTLARSLIGKKVRPVRVTIPAGYRVLLHPQNYGL